MKHILVEDKNNTEAFYDRLREELENSTEWPSEYMYKFIIPSDTEKKEQVEAVFNHSGAVIGTKKSSNGTYTSISITLRLNNPDEVIAYYKKVSTIKDVISL